MRRFRDYTSVLYAGRHSAVHAAQSMAPYTEIYFAENQLLDVRFAFHA